MTSIDVNFERRNHELELSLARWRAYPMKCSFLGDTINQLSDELDELNELLNEAFGEGFERGIMFAAEAARILREEL